MTNAKHVIEMFDAAASKLQHPHVTIQLPTGKIKFSRAGANSKSPGVVHISDGGPFGNNVYYGKIERDGTLILRTTVATVIATISEFIANPVEATANNGRKTNNCCFCGRTLTDTRSVHFGYGPICAEKWNLPWEYDAIEVTDIEEFSL